MRVALVFSLLLIIPNIYLAAQETIYDVMPGEDCEGIVLSGSPELYVGDDLFNLINGGAELYHEFGFVEVIAAETSGKGETPVKTEVYDMGSAEAAWGIYSLTATSNAMILDLGDAGRKGEGFIQFIKGRYMVYLYFASSDNIAIPMITDCLSNKISESSGPPEIMKALNLGDEAKLTYFRGNLGLQSLYTFHYKDVFGYDEGAAAVYPDLKVFLLKYDNEEDCIEKYNNALEFFLSSSKYHDQTTLPDYFSMKDKKERKLEIHLLKEHILIFAYDESGDAKPDIDGIKANINKNL